MIQLTSCPLLRSLDDITLECKVQINTINAHSYNVAKNDLFFAKVLLQSDFLLPDGQSIVWAKKWLIGEKYRRITGYDLFEWELERINKIGGKGFFLGSNDSTLSKISDRIQSEYPNIVIEVYSPPYKAEFSESDNRKIFDRINSFKPDVLFIGMTAPKQEKWAFENKDELDVGHICSIGAVFDFYARTIERAPEKWQKNGLEWLYRLIKEPKRMWKRYIIGNTLFICYIVKEKILSKTSL